MGQVIIFTRRSGIQLALDVRFAGCSDRELLAQLQRNYPTPAPEILKELRQRGLLSSRDNKDLT